MPILRRLRIINNRIGSEPQNEENPAVFNVLRDFLFNMAEIYDRKKEMLAHCWRDVRETRSGVGDRAPTVAWGHMLLLLRFSCMRRTVNI